MNSHYPRARIVVNSSNIYRGAGWWKSGGAFFWKSTWNSQEHYRFLQQKVTIIQYIRVPSMRTSWSYRRVWFHLWGRATVSTDLHYPPSSCTNFIHWFTIQVVNEVMKGIRVVKYYTLEQYFTEKIGRLRNAEICSLAGRKYLDALCVYFWATTPVLISILTFGTYALLGNEVTAAKVKKFFGTMPDLF